MITSSPDVWSVLLLASITAVATGFGALPLLFMRSVPGSWLGIANAVAAGLMGGASMGLVFEGQTIGPWRTILGILLGLGFIVFTRQFIGHDDVSFGEMEGLDARKALLILSVMTLHSFTEGVGVGVSFGGGEALGLFITIAIAVHNIPEGLAIALVMVPRGTPVWKAFLWSVFSSLPQPIMAVPAFLFVEAFHPVLPVGLGFAAGAMIWMIVSELLPDALEETTPNAAAVTFTLSFAAILGFQVLLRY